MAMPSNASAIGRNIDQRGRRWQVDRPSRPPHIAGRPGRAAACPLRERNRGLRRGGAVSSDVDRNNLEATHELFRQDLPWWTVHRGGGRAARLRTAGRSRSSARERGGRGAGAARALQAEMAVDGGSRRGGPVRSLP